MQSYPYWLGTEYAPNPNKAWGFGPNDGAQDAGYNGQLLYAMPVRSGDVLLAPVPEPETYMMLLLGLGAVGALSRRRARALGASAL